MTNARAKKILFIETQSEFGGAQRFIYTFVNGLRNYELVVAAGMEGDDEKGLLAMLERAGISVRRLKYLRRGINPLFDFCLGIVEIYRLVKKEKPDVLFLCSSKAGAIGSLAAHLYRRYARINLASQDAQIRADTDNKELLYSDVTYKIRGACFKVWKQFRGAFKEKIIENALMAELENCGLKIETQKRIPISYEGREVGVYVPDAIVNDKVLIELKSKPRLTREDQKQFWLYLKGSKYRLGLLINFGKQLEIKRKVYDTARNNSASISVLPKAQNQRLSAKLPRVIYRIGGWTFNDPWPKWKKKIYILIEKWTARWKDIIIVNAECHRKQAIELGIKPKKEILTIYNGLGNLEFLSREKAKEFLNLEDSDFVVGTIANDYPSKGLKYLKKAAEILKDKNIKFTIIGKGNRFVPEAYKYLKAFDVFVLPSVKEGFPWVILEAMAAEVPIVATKVGALPEILENPSTSLDSELDSRSSGQAALLVGPGDAKALSQAILTLLENYSFRISMAESAKKVVEEKFSLEKMVNEIEKLF